jgi:hypothetical protein
MSDVTLYNWITVDGEEWGVHLWGTLEEYEDGTRQVVDIDARYLLPNGVEQDANTKNLTVPEEVVSLAHALLESPDTSDDMLKHGAIH